MAHDKDPINGNCSHYFTTHRVWYNGYKHKWTTIVERKYPWLAAIWDAWLSEEKDFSPLQSANISGGKEFRAKNPRDWILLAHSFQDSTNQNWIPLSSFPLHIMSQLPYFKLQPLDPSLSQIQGFKWGVTVSHHIPLDINPILSSGSPNNVLEPCLRESGAVTCRDDV